MFFSKCAERKRIDYVLVYGRDTTKDPEKDDKRNEFEEGLKKSGIELEYEDVEVSLRFPYNTSIFVQSRSTSTAMVDT